MSQEVKNQEMSDAEFSYESLRERKAAEAQLYNLRKERNARHEEEKKQLAENKSIFKRLAICWRSSKQDRRDDEREEELLEIANPMSLYMQYRENHK